jgi:hypothetical protein
MEEPVKHRIRRPFWATSIVICLLLVSACAPSGTPSAQEPGVLQATAVPTTRPVPASPSPAATATSRPTPTWVPTLPIITPTITPTPLPTSPPPTPMPKQELHALLTDSRSAMQALATFHMDSEAQVTAGDTVLAVASTSQIEMPDTVYTSTDAAGTKVESLQLGDDSYFRTADSGSWMSVSADSPVIPRIANPLAELQIANLEADLQQLKDMRLDGVLCYRFALTLDLNDFLIRTGYSLEDLMLTDVNPVGVDLEREIWIGQNDLLVRLSLTKLHFTYEGQPFDMAITNHLHSFDQPVSIPTP